MATPFEQFRSRYPEGGLLADLISIHDGQYVVRAVVTNQGTTLATGLATSVDVQIAEDRARDRALAVLGIETATPIAEPVQPSPVQPSSVQPSTDSTPADTTHQSEPSVSPEEVAPEEVAPEEVDDTSPPIDAIAEEPIAPVETAPSAAVIALENFNTSATPVDLSDVIAQTDVELARLGWTNMQGREYLEKTYGKRSRQQLTDEELLSFLLYLEEL